MKLKLSDKNEILAYATIGHLEGEVDYTGTIPIDFETRFNPSYYLMQNNEIVINPDYVAPQEPILDSTPNRQDEINAMLLKEVATLHTQLGGLNNG